MGLTPPASTAGEGKIGLARADSLSDNHTGESVPDKGDKVDGDYPQKPEESQPTGFLSAPLSGPIRPLSPDTLSNLSTDEYEQIRLGRLPSEENGTLRSTSHVSQSPAPLSRGWRGRLAAFWVHNKGLAYIILAQIFGTLMNVTTRLLEVEGNLGKGLHPFQILFPRMGITLVLASLWMWYKKTPHFPMGAPEVRWLLVARGFGGFFGVFGMYYSLLYLPLADATVITFLAPSLACWACSILINEPFTRMEQIAGLVSLVGVVLIARPTTLLAAFGSSAHGSPSTPENDGPPAHTNGTSPIDSDASNYDGVTPMQRLSAVGVALIGVLGAAAAYTTIRWIGKRAHPLISVNYFAAWCTFVSIVLQLSLPGVGFVLPANTKEWGYLTFLGTCGFITQFLLAAGLSYEKSSRATNIMYTQMLFALGFDKLVFGHTPSLMSIIGSSLILSSAIFVAMQKHTADPIKPRAGRPRDVVQGEESDRGLLNGMDSRSRTSHEMLPLHEVQIRTLR